MTSAEIWWNLNQITPKKPIYGLACAMTSLDNQTILELIDKYKKDLSLTIEEIQDEIKKQRRKKLHEL